MLRYASRPYMFTASPSPATVATSLAAVRKLRAEPERRKRLAVNSARLHSGFKALGLLLKAGVYVNIALPPGTPGKQCLLRCSVSAAHAFEDIDLIIVLFGKVVAQGHYKQAV